MVCKMVPGDISKESVRIFQMHPQRHGHFHSSTLTIMFLVQFFLIEKLSDEGLPSVKRNFKGSYGFTVTGTENGTVLRTL